MQINTIRAHTLGVSVGNPLSVEPSLDVFNEGAYESIDFAILAARIYGIKVFIGMSTSIINSPNNHLLARYSASR